MFPRQGSRNWFVHLGSGATAPDRPYGFIMAFNDLCVVMFHSFWQVQRSLIAWLLKVVEFPDPSIIIHEKKNPPKSSWNLLDRSCWEISVGSKETGNKYPILTYSFPTWGAGTGQLWLWTTCLLSIFWYHKEAFLTCTWFLMVFC